MALHFTIKGKQVAVENFLRDLESEKTIANDPSVSIGAISSVSDTAVLRKPLGLEPLVYFVVVYSAHLAAGLTHDAIRKWLTEHSKASAYKLSIEEGEGTSEVHDAPADSITNKCCAYHGSIPNVPTRLFLR